MYNTNLTLYLTFYGKHGISNYLFTEDNDQVYCELANTSVSTETLDDILFEMETINPITSETSETLTLETRVPILFELETINPLMVEPSEIILER